MDFEFAFWQMTYLFLNPQIVYRNFQHRKETKSQFARDDPAFLVLLSSCLLISSIGFAIVLDLSFGSFLMLLLYFVFVDCIGSGLIVATVLWYATNKYLIKNSCRDQDVEWAYAFDVHLNAFTPLLVISHIVQLLFFNLFIKGSGFLPMLFGNSIWMIAVGYYFYITFLGYKNLKILKSTQIFLFPFVAIFLLFLISLIMGLNLSEFAMDYYHYRVL